MVMTRYDRFRAAFAVLTAVFTVVLVFSYFRMTPGDSGENPEEPGSSPEAEEALALVEAIAAVSGPFRQAWEEKVRSAADHLTARIAGAWMAASAGGTVSGSWATQAGEETVQIPVPRELPPEYAEAAFSLAVHNEVSRRVEAMTGPGAFG